MPFRHGQLLAASLHVCAAGADSAQAADVAPPEADLWTGFYLGAQAGYLQGTGSDTDLCFSASGFGSECFGSRSGLDIGCPGLARSLIGKDAAEAAIERGGCKAHRLIGGD